MEKERKKGSALQHSSQPSCLDVPATQHFGAGFLLCLPPVPFHKPGSQKWEPLMPSQPQGTSPEKVLPRRSYHSWVSHLGCPSPAEPPKDCSPREQKNHPADPSHFTESQADEALTNLKRDVPTDTGTASKTKQRWMAGSSFLFSVDELIIINS